MLFLIVLYQIVTLTRMCLNAYVSSSLVEAS